MPARHLRVDPVDLRVSADQMDMHHRNLQQAHTAADSAIEDAQSGWVGVSAAALQAKLAGWQETTTALLGEVAGMGDGLRTAADDYEHTDEAGGDDISRAL